ncbi:hypothetical protein DFP72DRAFT_1041921 [Ephemerocybe angulata]|uniref:F-box domain-containing protein n=1 Tax=Ephemerocybe angulata TaxID=980116 RepID=A0A8H6MDD2_9AGAR|nr:hypothetical protein DFP72DRAFT_1041921 [Tulosesus angulatus]
MSPPKRSIFDILPLELIGRIVKYAPGIHTLRCLRLVSKVMKEFADPLAFASTTISFLNGLEEAQSHLGSLISGNGPNSRWTTHLSIKELVPSEPDFEEDYDDYYVMWDLQQELLIPAIKALKDGLTRVDLDLTMAFDPHVDIFEALAGFPKLRVLNVSVAGIDSHNRDEDGVFPQISGLEELNINSTGGESGDFQKEARNLIVPSLPTLKKLCLNFTSKAPSDLSTLLIPGPPEVTSLLPSVSMIQHLRLHGSTYFAGRTSALYLKNLTHLDIHNDLKVSSTHGDDPNALFWDALSEANIRLQLLFVNRVTPTLLQYLASYSGLVGLKIGGESEAEAYKNRQEGSESLARNLFDSVIPHHCNTLKPLSFSHCDYRAWSVTEDYLKQILLCKSLVRLDIIYHFPKKLEVDKSFVSATPFIEIASLLSRLLDGTLPNLLTLIVVPAREPDDSFGLSWITSGPRMKLINGWRDLACGADLSSVSKSQVLTDPSFKLYFSLNSFTAKKPEVTFDRNNGHFKPVPKK